MSNTVATPPVAPSSVEPSGSQLTKLIVGTLTRLMHPSIVNEAIRSAASDAGIAGIDAYLAEVQQPPSGAKRGKRSGAGKEDKTGRRGAGVHPFTIFVTKTMERIKENPVYHKHTHGADGKPTVRGASMSMAGALWKGLSEETREAFNRAYQPLCDQLRSEQQQSGLKTDNLRSRIHDFEAGFSASTKALLKTVLPDKLPANLVAAAAAAADAGTADASAHGLDLQGEEEEASGSGDGSGSGDSEEGDDDDDEEEARKQEAERLAREEAARQAKAAEEERKKQKKEAKKEAKKQTPNSEGKKKKHKGDDVANGGSKKAKK